MHDNPIQVRRMDFAFPEDIEPVAGRDLFAWHLIEELEHRTVAFDVYEHVCGSHPYRIVFGLHAQWHMARWIGRVARYMLPGYTPSKIAFTDEMVALARRYSARAAGS